MTKAKAKSKKRKVTTPQEEVTHLGVIINLMLQMDKGAQERVTAYLVDRFGSFY